MSNPWRLWVPCVVLLLVASWQRIQVEGRGLTPWKGGGMGMYSDFHYRDHELWLRLDGEGRDPQYEYLSQQELRGLLPAASRCLRFAHTQCLTQLSDRLSELCGGVDRPFTLQIWTFARNSRGFTRHLLVEVQRP